MTVRRLLRRLGFAVVAAFVVMTVTFAFIALTGDPTVAILRYGLASAGVPPEEINATVDAYRAARNLDEPVLQRYVRWLGNVVTLQWGRSFASGEPVTAIIAARVPFTLAYVVPGLALSGVGALALGLYSATDPAGDRGRLAAAASYVAHGVPGFWIAAILILAFKIHHGWVATRFDADASVFASQNLVRLVLPALLLALGVLAGQARHVRSATRERATREFVRLLRAKGAGPRVVARHVLRNAAAPLVSLFFVDLLAVLVVNVYVIEYVFDIPGFAMLSYQAIKNHDLPVVLGTTMVIAFVGIAANLVQDVSYAALDPRVGGED